MAKPAIKVGDIVLADRSWWLVLEKEGQRITASLLSEGLEGRRHPRRFTTRQVERVFRELGVGR